MEEDSHPTHNADLPAATRDPTARRSSKTGRIVVVVSALALLACFAPVIYRARQEARRDICIHNLSQIDAAKQQWAIDARKTVAAEPRKADFIGPRLYLKIDPQCPSSGVYTIGAVGELPTCSLAESHGHFWDGKYSTQQ